MAVLFRTTCSTDWKCRPTHDLVIIAKSDSREHLLEKMDRDVEQWQAADVEYDNDLLRKESEEEGTALSPVTEWEKGNERFEMDLPPGSLRKFAIHDRESGARTTIVYHIVTV